MTDDRNLARGTACRRQRPRPPVAHATSPTRSAPRRRSGAHVRHDAVERQYMQLYRDPNIDVWLICWAHRQDTGYHDHDRSSGAVVVCEGACSRTTSTATRTAGSARRRTGTRRRRLVRLRRRLHPRRPQRRAASPRPRSTATRPRSGGWGTTRPTRRRHAPGRDDLRRRAARRRVARGDGPQSVAQASCLNHRSRAAPSRASPDSASRSNAAAAPSARKDLVDERRLSGRSRGEARPRG